MDGERIFLIILMCFLNLMIAGIMYAIGLWAQNRKDPMHFYSGTTVDPKTISDIPAYNLEIAKMWKEYASAYLLCGVFAFGSIWLEALMTVCIVILCISCTAGCGWLVWKYSKIHKRYKI